MRLAHYKYFHLVRQKVILLLLCLELKSVWVVDNFSLKSQMVQRLLLSHSFVASVTDSLDRRCRVSLISGAS